MSDAEIVESGMRAYVPNDIICARETRRCAVDKTDNSSKKDGRPETGLEKLDRFKKMFNTQNEMEIMCFSGPLSSGSACFSRDTVVAARRRFVG